MAITNHDGTIAVTGESVRPVADLIILHGWKRAATMKVKHGMTDRHYSSVRKFNETYGVKAKSWAQVLEVTTDVIKDIQAELDQAKAAQSA